MKIKEYLERFVENNRKVTSNRNLPYASFEEFVLKNGREYTKRQDMKVKRGKPKECFMNAYRLADEMGLTYVEGFAFTKTMSKAIYPLLFLHVWCVDNEGNVYDPTWKDGEQYFGVAFNMNYLWKTIYSRRISGVINNPEEGFPLLSGKHKKFKKE